MKRARLALPLVLILFACDGQPRATTTTRAIPEDAPPARGCPRENWPGPWTACAEAKWVARIAADAGYRIAEETGSALVAEGRGDSFYIWTTRHAIVPPPAKIVEDEGWKVLGRVGRVQVYGDVGLWRWWSTDDTIFWIKAGPHESSTVPDVTELERLVAASLRLQPPS